MSILSLFDRRSMENPAVPISEALDNIFASQRTTAGTVVTNEGALALSTVFACVRLIAGGVSMLPLKVYKRLDDGEEVSRSHPLYNKLRYRPNPMMTAASFRWAMQAHMLLWGSAYAEIERNQANQPLNLWPIHPSKVRVVVDGSTKVYMVRGADGTEKPHPPDSILHLMLHTLDGYTGMSVLQYARQSMGLGLAAEEFGARFFGGGSRLSGVLKHPAALSDGASARLRASWEQIHGGLANSHKVAILEEGMDFAAMSVPPNDAQFLETREFQVEEIARWFGVPPHLVGHTSKSTSWGSGIEAQNIGFLQYSLDPWLNVWEETLAWELFGDRSDHFCQFERKGLLRADVASRYQAYAVGREKGWLSGNDIRRLEGMNPASGLDVYLVPRNMAPADRLNELIDAEVAPKPAPAPPPPPAPPAEPEADDVDE
jgi:HK97 family phage portal protein